MLVNVQGAGRCWTMLVNAGRSWSILDDADRCSHILIDAGRSLLVLRSVQVDTRRCMLMLDKASWCWTILVDTWRSFLMLDNSARYWTMLVYAGRCWSMLDDAGQSWTILDSAGRYWTMLVDARRCQDNACTMRIAIYTGEILERSMYDTKNTHENAVTMMKRCWESRETMLRGKYWNDAGTMLARRFLPFERGTEST